jgi:hypothetical protein
MKAIINPVKYNLFLVKPYWKQYLLLVGFALGFPLLMKDLGVAPFYSAFLIFMTVSYTFSIEEKNNGMRFIGMVPFKRSQLVIGRYLMNLMLFLIFWLIVMLIEPILFDLLNVTAKNHENFWQSGLLALVYYLILASFSLPGFYKYGAIKGRWMIYIPLVLIVLLVFIAQFFNWDSAKLEALLNPMVLLPAGVLLLILSLLVSIRIMDQKEF